MDAPDMFQMKSVVVSVDLADASKSCSRQMVVDLTELPAEMPTKSVGFRYTRQNCSG
jgi:hypothetical protein